MSEARIGRIAAVAVHEAVAARLPLRLEYYEYWLRPPRLLAGSVGVASFQAVLSFLRQEEAGIYDTVVAEAGQHAADWLFADVPVWTRLRWRWLPRGHRFNAALRLGRRLADASYSGTHGRAKWRRRQGSLEIDGSPFCSVRTPTDAPLCGFYLAALERLCEHLDLQADVHHESCRAMGASQCVLAVAPPNGRTENHPPAVPGRLLG
jgi:hypothetical protein